MSDFSVRENLIMTFACSECGRKLTLRRAHQEEVKSEAPRSTDDPSGAYCRYAETVQVDPCRHCIEAKTGPAEKLAAAIRELTGEGAN